MFRELAGPMGFPDELVAAGFTPIGSIPHRGGQKCTLYVSYPAPYLQAPRQNNSFAQIALADDDLVVVKLLDTLDDEWATDAFRREIAVLRNIRADHVPWLYDSGPLRDGRQYFVQKYVDGPNLHEYVSSGLGAGQPFPEDEWRLLARSLARTLSVVHEHKVCHLDIKPANIVLKGGRNEPWLVDFGIARTEADLQRFEPAGLALTAAYAAPETMVDPFIRGAFSDVYSLCLTLAFAAMGHTIRDTDTGTVDLDLLPSWASEALTPGLEPDYTRRLRELPDGCALLHHFDGLDRLHRQSPPDNSPTQLVDWLGTQIYGFSGPPTEPLSPPPPPPLPPPPPPSTLRRGLLLYLLNLGHDIEHNHRPARLGIILMGVATGLLSTVLILAGITYLL